MNLLWLSSRWPFPADDGAKQASASLLLALADRGHKIHVVTFARESALAPSPHARVKLLAHHHAGKTGILTALKSLPSDLPVSSVPFKEFRLSWRALREKLGHEPDAVVLDGPHAYAALGGESCPWKLVYRAHNVEASLWRQAGERAFFPLKAYFSLQARRMRKFEEALCLAAGRVAAISQEDTDEFTSWGTGASVKWVPVGFHFTEPAAPPPGPLTFGFLGRLDWPPNREGLEWFLNEVWPQVKAGRPGARLLVAGSGRGEWLDAYPPELFERRGRLDRVEDFYAHVHATLAPIHYGSGTKIKVLESARFGRAVFATPQALQGSGLGASGMALVSSGAQEWIARMTSCQPDQLVTLGGAAFAEAKAMFSSVQAAQRFEVLLS